MFFRSMTLALTAIARKFWYQILVSGIGIIYWYQINNIEYNLVRKYLTSAITVAIMARCKWPDDVTFMANCLGVSRGHGTMMAMNHE